MTRRITRFAIILSLLSFCFFPTLTTQSQQTTTPRRDFEVRDIGALDALIRLGETYDQPIGLVTADNKIATMTVSVQVSEATPVEAMAALMHQLPAYVWSESRGVVLVQPRSMPPAAKEMLETVIPRFAAKNSSTDHLSTLLWWELQRRLDPQTAAHGYFGISHDAGQPTASVDLHNATVQEILGEIVKMRKSAAWIALPYVGSLKGMPRDRLWNIVSYTNPPQPLSQLCCLTKEYLN